MARKTTTARPAQSERQKRKAARTRATDARRKAAAMHAVWSPRRWPRMTPLLTGVGAATYVANFAAAWPATVHAAALAGAAVGIDPSTHADALQAVASWGTL